MNRHTDEHPQTTQITLIRAGRLGGVFDAAPPNLNLRNLWTLF
jgi:hypothetical protein